MNYQQRIREIMSSFVMGYADRETCISQFEALLHQHGLLPLTEQIDRTITNENFLALLKMAKDHPPQQQQADQQQKDMRHAPAMDAITRLIFPEHTQPNYNIASSVQQRCPVCQQKCDGVYNSMKTLDHQVFQVDPPRCRGCMLKWVEEKFGAGIGSSIPNTPEPSFTPDITAASPMRPDEFDFFKQYEQDMEGFKP